MLKYNRNCNIRRLLVHLHNISVAFFISEGNSAYGRTLVQKANQVDISFFDAVDPCLDRVVNDK